MRIKYSILAAILAVWASQSYADQLDLSGPTVVMSSGENVASGGAAVDNILDFVSGEVSLPSDLGGAGTGAILVNEPEGQYVMMHGIQRGSEWGFSVYEMEIDAAPVPEPSNMALLGGVVLVLVIGFRRSRKNR